MTKVENHLEMLWKINECGIGDQDNIIACFEALNQKYGVNYKLVTDLEDEDYEYCNKYCDGKVEDLFSERINTMGIGYYDFQRYCQLYMDLSKMYTVSKPKSNLFNHIANIVRQDALNRFGIKLSA